MLPTISIKLQKMSPNSPNTFNFSNVWPKKGDYAKLSPIIYYCFADRAVKNSNKKVTNFLKTPQIYILQNE